MFPHNYMQVMHFDQISDVGSFRVPHLNVDNLLLPLIDDILILIILFLHCIVIIYILAIQK